VTGRYNIFGAWGYQSSASPAGYRIWQISVNSTTLQYRNMGQPFASVLAYGTIAANGVQLNAGDFVTLVGLQNQGSALSLIASGTGFPAKFIIEYVGA
jgi:hypothetical protein